jgi:hypothetical protein
MLPGIQRLGGVTVACSALVCYFLIRWGIRGIFSLGRPWRIILFVMALLLGLLGGFRSMEIMVALLLICQFSVEGLWGTRFLPMLLGLAVLGGVLLFGLSENMPLAAQRAVSFLPVKVDPIVEYDAAASVEWRLDMWRVLVPQIPKYLWLGKGYAIDPDELYFAMVGRGAEDVAAQASLVAGDYHNGPLTVILPLGIWGVIAFIWLLGAGVNVLYRNFRYGDPALLKVNAFLLAYFLMQSIFFFTIFGAFRDQLYMFTGLLGLSVSLNGGAQKPRRVSSQAVASPPADSALSNG